jgi:hypothetical protein
MPAWRRVTVLRQAPETQRPSAQVGGKTGRYCLCLLLARAILSAHAAARTTNGTIRGEPASPHNGRRVARPMELILDHIAPDLQLLPGDGVPEKALSGEAVLPRRELSKGMGITTSRRAAGELQSISSLHIASVCDLLSGRVRRATQRQLETRTNAQRVFVGPIGG